MREYDVTAGQGEEEDDRWIQDNGNNNDDDGGIGWVVYDVIKGPVEEEVNR